MNNMKQEHIIDVISLLFTIILLGGLIFAIKTFYIPTPLDVAELSDYQPLLLAAPEPVEFIQYVLGTLCVPIFLWLSYVIARHFVGRTIKSVQVPRIYLISLILEIGILIWVIYKSLQTSDFLYVRGFAGSDSILFLYPLEYSVLIFPILMILGFYVASAKMVKMLTWLFFIYLITAILAFNIHNLERIIPYAHHFNVVFYPVSQILQCKTLLVNLNAQYGLYGHLLEPLFRILGLNVLNFSIVMALLVASGFYFIFLFLKRTVENNIIVLLGFTSVSYYTYFIHKVRVDGGADPYFQYTPIRFLFPCLILYLSVIYFKGQSKSVYYFTFIASSLTILWNLETGIVVFASWLISVVYFEFLHITNYRLLIKNILKIIITGAAILCTVVSLYVFYTYLRSGLFPDSGQAIFYQKMFSTLGLSTLPMPSPPHYWNIVIFIYLVGLLSSLKALYKQKNSHHPCVKQMAIFISSIMGIGLFSYYQGRSHDYNLLMVPYHAFLVLALFADSLMNDLKKSKLDCISHQSLLLIVILYFFSNSLFSLLYHTDQLFNTIKVGVDTLRYPLQNTSPVSKNVAFIKQHSHPGESILILASDDSEGIYYGESQTRSIIDIPSSVEWILKRDIEQIVTFLETNISNKVFVYPAKDYNLHYEAINQVLKTRYEVVAQSEGGMALLRPSKFT